MLVAYASCLYFQLRSQHNLYDPIDGDVVNTVEESDDEEAPEITYWEAISWLAILTLWVSVLSGYLVDAIQAPFCYWITSNLFSMSYGLAIRHPEVRKFLDLTGAPLSPPSTPTSQSQSELPSVSATQQQNTPSESKPPSETSKVADRRTSSHAIMKQRIRYLEEKLKGNKGRKKKKQ